MLTSARLVLPPPLTPIPFTAADTRHHPFSKKMRIKGELANGNIETQTLFVSYQMIDDDGWRWSSFRALPAARFFSVPGIHGVDGG